MERDIFLMNPRHKRLFEYLKYIDNPIVNVKVIFNGCRVGKFVFTNNDASIRKIMYSVGTRNPSCGFCTPYAEKIPTLEKRKLYSLSIYCKENGEYYPTELSELFVLVDDADKFVMFEYKNNHWYSMEEKYLRHFYDYILGGQSKKKIIIRETDKKLYDIHVCSVHSESVAQMRIYDFNKSILIATKEQVHIQKEVQKILHSYHYTINKIIHTDNCVMDSENVLIESGPTNKIYVEVRLEGKKERIKGLWKRFTNLFIDRL
jgi:hypothetical protein